MGWFSSTKGSLLKAAKNGDLAGVKQALAQGADPDGKDWTGLTALSWAALRGHIEIVRALLAAKADPSPFDGSGRSPLVHAAANGHLEIVRVLLQSGADPNLCNQDGLPTFLVFVLALESASPTQGEIVREMIAAGLDIHAQDIKGGLPLVIASQAGFIEIVRVLLDCGADINARDGGGSTALMLAADMNRADVIRLLAARGADLDARAEHKIARKHNIGGNVLFEIGDLTALMIAAVQGRSDAVVALIEAGADTDLQASDGSTAYGLATLDFRLNTAGIIEEVTKARKVEPKLPAS